MNLKHIIFSTLTLTTLTEPIIASSSLTEEEIAIKYEIKRTGFYDVDKYMDQSEQEKPLFLEKVIRKNEDFVKKLQNAIRNDSTAELNGMYYTIIGDLFKDREHLYNLLKNVDFTDVEKQASISCAKLYFEKAINKFETVIDINNPESLRVFYEESSKNRRGSILFYYGYALKNMDLLTGQNDTIYLTKLRSLVPILIEKPDMIVSLPDEGRRYNGANGTNMFTYLGYGNRLLAFINHGKSLNHLYSEKPALVLESIQIELENRNNKNN